jgi:hypothetical protein
MDLMKAQSAKDQVTSKYLASPNVLGAGVGVKFVDGRPTTEPAVVIFVEKKYPKDYIRKQSELDLIPQKVDGIVTDVIEVGKITPQNSLRSKVRPICPGISIGHQNVTAGTLGGIFLDADGDLVTLSNNHVIAAENKAKSGDIIFQPGPLDNPGPESFKGWKDNPENLHYYGTLKKFNQIHNENNLHDSAIAAIHPSYINNNLVNATFPSLNRTIAGFGDARLQMPVQKLGRTTGYTTGQVISLKATFTIGYDFGPATFNDCIVCTSMSAGGDSGSIIMDMDMNAVALLFAGSDKVTLGNPFKHVKDYYGLQLWHGKPTPPTTLFDTDWQPSAGQGHIELLNGRLIVKARANEACFWQKRLTGHFDLARVSVTIDSDQGATWGPGLVVAWSGGMLKMNMRSDNQVCGSFNTNQYLMKTNGEKKVSMRIRRAGEFLSGEYLSQDGVWTSVMNIHHSALPGEPIELRIGKTDALGGRDNHSTIGPAGTCIIEDLLLS